MARAAAGPPAGIRLSDHISLGVIARTFPLDRVQQVLAETGKASERERDLPAYVMVYHPRHGLPRDRFGAVHERQHPRGAALPAGGAALALGCGGRQGRVAGKSGISQARTRLGAEPLRRLHDQLVRPAATRATRGAWHRRWRLVSLDGSCLEVVDSAANREAFGLPGASRGASAFPQLRFVALVENGTHVLFGTHLGRYEEGETSLARSVLAALQPGMLCLADRPFFGHALWQEAAATGADLLWRVKRNLRLPREAVLADGSYLTTIHPSQKDRRHRANGRRLRVVEHRLAGLAGAEPLYRLATTLLDPSATPAAELAALHHERWEIEGRWTS
jgi:hypothetical protein